MIALGYVFGLMPRWAWALVAGGLVAWAAAERWQYGREQRAAGEATVQERWDAAKEKQRLVDAAERRRLQAQTKEIDDDHARKAARSAATAAATRAELGRLRNELSAARAAPAASDPAAAAEPDAATAHDRVVLECAAEFAALGEHADAIEDRLADLQTWVGRVCVTQ
jgi:hypothetical protein